MDIIETISKDMSKLKDFIEYLSICDERGESEEVEVTPDRFEEVHDDSGKETPDTKDEDEEPLYTPTPVVVDESDPIADLVRAVSIHYE